MPGKNVPLLLLEKSMELIKLRDLEIRTGSRRQIDQVKIQAC